MKNDNVIPVAYIYARDTQSSLVFGFIVIRTAEKQKLTHTHSPHTLYHQSFSFSVVVVVVAVVPYVFVICVRYFKRRNALDSIIATQKRRKHVDSTLWKLTRLCQACVWWISDSTTTCCCCCFVEWLLALKYWSFVGIFMLFLYYFYQYRFRCRDLFLTISLI